MYYGSLITEILLHGFTSDVNEIFKSESSIVFPDTGVWDENIWDLILARVFYLLIKGKYDELDEIEFPFPITQENYVHMTLVELIRIMGIIRKGDYDHAKIRLRHVNRLIENCPPTSVDKLTIMQFTIWSYLNLERGEIEEAFEIIKNTDRMLKSLKNDHPLISENFERYWFSYLKNNLGLVKIYMGRYEEAEKEFEEVLDILDEFEYAQIKFFAWMNLAYTCQILGKYKKAIKNLEKSAESIVILGNEGDLPYVLRELGRTNFELGNLDQAEIFFRKAFEQAKTFANLKVTVERADDLHNFYCAQNDLDAAQFLLKDLDTYITSCQNDQSVEHIISLIKCRHKMRFGRFVEILESKQKLLDFIQKGKFTDILQSLNARITIISIQLMEYRVSRLEIDLDNLIFLVEELIEEAKMSKLREIQIRGETLLLHLYIESENLKKAEELIYRLEKEKETVNSIRIENLIDEEIRFFRSFLLSKEKQLKSFEQNERTMMNPILEDYLMQVSEIVKKFN